MNAFRNSLQIAKKSLHADIFTTLRNRIVCLDLEPGTPLNEKELCEEFGVSRTPLREAIRRLEDLNLVTVIPRYGTHVSSLDLNELLCAMEIKVKLEGLAAEAAARRGTPELVKRMEEALVRLESHLDNEEFGKSKLITTEESLLHEIVWEAAGNPLLIGFLDNLQYRCARVWNSVLVDTIEPKKVLEQLTGMVAAIKAHEPEEAARITEAHVRYFADNLKEKLL